MITELIASLSLIIDQHTPSIAHNAIFTCGDASVFCQFATRRRPTLPYDAQDVLILIEYPAFEDQPGWTLDVRIALRGGDLWNPKTHLKIVDARADDTEDESVIFARVI